jgi:hypothetical protein
MILKGNPYSGLPFFFESIIKQLIFCENKLPEFVLWNIAPVLLLAHD